MRPQSAPGSARQPLDGQAGELAGVLGRLDRDQRVGVLPDVGLDRGRASTSSSSGASSAHGTLIPLPVRFDALDRVGAAARDGAADLLQQRPRERSRRRRAPASPAGRRRTSRRGASRTARSRRVRSPYDVRTRARRPAVRIRGPSAVIATVCSKCAASEPSALEIDHSSSCSTTSAPPAVIIGSIAKVIPSASCGPAAGLAVVRDLRLLVHRAADAVADEAADDREALLLGGDLDRVRDVGEPVADAALLDPGRERGLAALEQALGLLGDLADRERVGRVRDEAVERHADVHGEDVAVAQRVHAGMPWTTISFGEAQIEAG